MHVQCILYLFQKRGVGVRTAKSLLLEDFTAELLFSACTVYIPSRGGKRSHPLGRTPKSVNSSFSFLTVTSDIANLACFPSYTVAPVSVQVIEVKQVVNVFLLLTVVALDAKV